MINLHKFKDLGKGNYGWLNANYHFSFANYYNPSNRHLNSLRVLNHDFISPHKGFDTHPHSDMEIITYIINGALTHVDSMGNKRTLHDGGVQYMSAGTGVHHSEYNNEDKVLELLQIWIFPNEDGLAPNYGDIQYSREDRLNRMFQIVSSKNESADININQDSSIYIGEFDRDSKFSIDLDPKEKFYLKVIRGEVVAGDIKAEEGDGVSSDESATLHIKKGAHLLLIKTK
jgi:redox-sensitive bicupin YhaK (pirin superfamily)